MHKYLIVDRDHHTCKSKPPLSKTLRFISTVLSAWCKRYGGQGLKHEMHESEGTSGDITEVLSILSLQWWTAFMSSLPWFFLSIFYLFHLLPFNSLFSFTLPLILFFLIIFISQKKSKFNLLLIWIIINS